MLKTPEEYKADITAVFAGFIDTYELDQSPHLRGNLVEQQLATLPFIGPSSCPPLEDTPFDVLQTVSPFDAVKKALWSAWDEEANEARLTDLYVSLLKGLVNGRQYVGRCCCMRGIFAKSAIGDLYRQDEFVAAYFNVFGVKPDADSIEERFFLAIEPGFTPWVSPIAKIAVQFIEAYAAENNLTLPDRVAYK